MENTRFILYLLVLGLVFLGLAAIKSLLPHPEPKRDIDMVGMALYRPVLYGEHSTKKASIKKAEEPVHTFVDNVVEDSPSENIVEEKRPKDRKETTKKVAPKNSTAKTKSANSDLSDSEYFEQMVVDYKNNVLSERRYRNDVVVRYYKHVPDEDRAEVLVDYGFYLHERKVRDSVRYNSIMSNVIYYGMDFPSEDLKLITYLLVNNGLEIKEIRRFKDFDGWKRNAIEIGGDPSLDNAPIISLQKIRKIK